MKNARVLSCVMALGAGGLAWADLIIPLDGGWQATVLGDSVADLGVDFVGEDLLVLEKFADFWEIDPVTGAPAPIAILFEQVAPDEETLSRIAITDEVVLNHTGLTWVDFHIKLLGPQVMWNPEDSADFSYDPFGVMEFSEDLHSVDFSEGSIEDGGMWTPGLASGALYIDVDLSPVDPVSFVLKELPTIPGPWGMVVLGIGWLGLPGRRARD